MKYSRILKNSAIYSVVSVLQRGISFFLLPLYTAYLAPEDYGTLSIVTSISSLLSVFILLALHGAAARFTYKNKGVEYERHLWGTLTTFILANSLFIGAIIIGLHKYIIDPFIGGINFFPFMFLGIVNTILSPLYLFFQSYLQTKQEGLKYGINTFLNFALNVSLIVLFLVVFKLGIIGVLLANLIVSLVFFIYVLIIYIPQINMGLKKDILKPTFKYSMPLIPHLLAAWSSGMIDKLFLNGMSGRSETGLYSVGQQFGGIIGMIASAINQAYIPWFFEKVEEGKDGLSSIYKLSIIVVIGYCFLAFSLSIFSKEILQLMVSDSFRGIWEIVPFLAFASVFQGLYYFFSSVLFLKHTSLVFFITISDSILNILLNIFLIPIYGLWGSVYACFFSLFLRSVLALIISEFVDERIRFKWKQMYMIVVVSFLLTFTNYLFTGIPILWSLFIKVIFLSVVLVFLLWFFKNDIYTYYNQLVKK